MEIIREEIKLFRLNEATSSKKSAPIKKGGKVTDKRSAGKVSGQRSTTVTGNYGDSSGFTQSADVGRHTLGKKSKKKKDDEEKEDQKKLKDLEDKGRPASENGGGKTEFGTA